MITLELELSPADQAFRKEVEAFIAEAFTPELREAARAQAGVFAEASLGLEWQRRLFRRGWGAPNWPREWGGAEFTPIQRYLFSVACAEAGTPIVAAMGLQMCGPVLMRYGTEEQKQRFLPRIPPAADYWCQGFSEPGAGSDLSALRCAAVRDGDDYVVTGSKIWTTHAHHANWMFLLVRTSTDGPRQGGISFLLTPMDAPGMTVRPIRSMSGEHEVNEVFLDAVRIPVASRVGAENQGWEIAKFLLMNERGGGSAAASLKSALHRARTLIAAERDEHGAALLEQPRFADRLAMLEIEIAAIEGIEQRDLIHGRGVGAAAMAAASMQKLQVSTLVQKLAQLAVDALGPAGVRDFREILYGTDRPETLDTRATAVARHMNVRAATIFGGAREIQKGIIAKGIGVA